MPQTNSYFQNAVSDPSMKAACCLTRAYRSAEEMESVIPLEGTLTLVIGPDPRTQRTWVVKKAFLAKHSIALAEYVTNSPMASKLSLPSIDPIDFANFVSYMHSSIYSLNEQVAGYRMIRHNTYAALLGMELGCKDYTAAAMRQLYMLFEPLSNLRTSNSRKSPIRASDVDFICEMTAPTTMTTQLRLAYGRRSSKWTPGAGLRQLFFDAVASHWTLAEVHGIGPHMDRFGDTARWLDVFNAYTDFRTALTRGGLWKGMKRRRGLRDCEEYVGMNGEGWMMSIGEEDKENEMELD